MDFGQRALVAAAQSPDAALRLLPEDGSGVRDLLDLQSPVFLRCRQVSPPRKGQGLCIVHIA